MIHTLAHNPEAILAAIVSAFVFVLIGAPVLYSMVSALAFMLSGIGAEVPWWRRLTAPGISLLGGFLFIGLLFLCRCFDGGAGEESPLWVVVAEYATALLWLLLPLPVCRLLLKFNWWRSLLATLLVSLLHGALAVAGLLGLCSLVGQDATATPVAPETEELVPAEENVQP